MRPASEQVLTFITCLMLYYIELFTFPGNRLHHHRGALGCGGSWWWFIWSDDINVRTLRSALLFLWKSRKVLLINSQQRLHFRHVTKQRGIPAGFPGMWGLWLGVGGRPLETMSLPSESDVFHTAAPKIVIVYLVLILHPLWVMLVNGS